jgi:hypothetical protein
MPADQALRRTRREMGDNPVVNVVLGARPNPNEQDDLRRLNVTANLQAGFRAIAGNALEDELRLIIKFRAAVPTPPAAPVTRASSQGVPVVEPSPKHPLPSYLCSNTVTAGDL